MHVDLIAKYRSNVTLALDWTKNRGCRKRTHEDSQQPGIFIENELTILYKCVVSDLESLAPQRFGPLTAAEIKLLRNAEIGGQAICGPNNDQNAFVNDPARTQSWDADRSIRGEIISWLCANPRAMDLVGPGGIQVFGAKIIGPVTLLSVTIQFPLVFACCDIQDDIDLQSARVRIVSFPLSHLKSIFADGAVIDGAVFLRRCKAGVLQFAGSRIEGQFDCTDSVFDSLTLDGAVIGVGLHLRRSAGRVKMTRARIGADFNCEDATLTATPGSDTALDAGGVNVDGSVLLRNGFHASGPVHLLGGQIGLNLDCTGGEFTSMPRDASKIDEALRADLLDVKGTVFLSKGFRAQGAVHFNSSRIGGDFDCTRARFDTGLAIERASVQGAFYWREVTIAGSAGLDLLNTSVDNLTDDRGSWPSPGHLEIHGFVYKRLGLASPRQAKERLNWLALQKSFASQPYRQLASVLKTEGDDAGTQMVLFEMEHKRREKEDKNRLEKLWSDALRWTISYGYYPIWALRWLLRSMILGLVLYFVGYSIGSVVPTDAAAYEAFKQNHQWLPAHYEHFHASMYSLENTFPIVKLGQAETWQPDPSPQRFVKRLRLWPTASSIWISLAGLLWWFHWAQILFGWLFATMFIAGVTGLIRKD